MKFGTVMKLNIFDLDDMRIPLTEAMRLIDLDENKLYRAAEFGVLRIDCDSREVFGPSISIWDFSLFVVAISTDFVPWIDLEETLESVHLFGCSLLNEPSSQAPVFTPIVIATLNGPDGVVEAFCRANPEQERAKIIEFARRFHEKFLSILSRMQARLRSPAFVAFTRP